MEDYKKVWHVHYPDDLRPELVPDNRPTFYPRTEVEPPAGDNIVVTGFDQASNSWVFTQKGLDEETTAAVVDAISKADLIDAEAIKLAQFYPDWALGVTYKQNNIVKYGLTDEEKPQLWRYHSPNPTESTEQLTPEAANYLWTKIKINESGDVVWVQPTGYENTYAKGTIVLYEPTGKRYESLIDGNSQVPGADEPHNRYWKELE